jgi:hypothetical protein
MLQKYSRVPKYEFPKNGGILVSRPAQKQQEITSSGLAFYFLSDRLKFHSTFPLVVL